jgi:hypothetical protein
MIDRIYQCATEGEFAPDHLMIRKWSSRPVAGFCIFYEYK